MGKIFIPFYSIKV